MMKKLMFLFSIILVLNASDEVNSNYKFYSNYGFSSTNTMLSTFKDARVALSVWIEKIAKSYGGRLDVRFYDNINLMYNKFKNEKKLDMIVVDLPFYFKNKEEILSISDNIWSISFDKEKYLQYYLVVNKSSNIKEMDDLKNKNISLKLHETSALVWLDKHSYSLYKKPYDKLFNKITYDKKESTSLLKVFFNKTDAAVISQKTWETMVELNPGIKKRVNIVKKSKRIFLPFIGFFSKNADKNSVKAFFDLSSKMKSLPESNQIITLLKFETIFKVDKSSLSELEECYSEYFSLKKRYK